MARDINDIQRDIERTRHQLAGTLNELADRTKPQHLVEDAKNGVLDKLKDPKVQRVLIGVAVAVGVVVGVNVVRARRTKRDLRDIRAFLAERSE